MRWTGFALGAEVSLAPHGLEHKTQLALQAVLAKIQRIEHLFSLSDPNALLSQRNRDGVLKAPPPDMVRLFDLSKDVHEVTQEHFNPTVQALWRAFAHGTANELAQAALGWLRISVLPRRIALDIGQTLTFNGIAQGYATDLVVDVVTEHGLSNVHVNFGKHAERGPARTLGVSDPAQGHLGHVTLQNAAVAVSSLGATCGARMFSRSGRSIGTAT